MDLLAPLARLLLHAAETEATGCFVVQAGERETSLTVRGGRLMDVQCDFKRGLGDELLDALLVRHDEKKGALRGDACAGGTPYGHGAVAVLARRQAVPHDELNAAFARLSVQRMQWLFAQPGLRLIRVDTLHTAGARFPMGAELGVVVLCALHALNAVRHTAEVSSASWRANPRGARWLRRVATSNSPGSTANFQRGAHALPAPAGRVDRMSGTFRPEVRRESHRTDAAWLAVLHTLALTERVAPCHRYALLLRKRRELHRGVPDHTLLELRPRASSNDAARALRRLAGQLHPDLFSAEHACLVAVSTEVVGALARAAHTLRTAPAHIPTSAQRAP